MVQAFTYEIEGLQCDAPGCGYVNHDAKLEDYESYVNTPCPSCGAILLTEADMRTVNIMLATAGLVNAATGDMPDDAPSVKVAFDMDGSGSLNPRFVRDAPSK